MASLMSCPPELRQQILSHCLPREVHNAGVAPRTTALLPLLLTSRAIRLDVLELLKSWSPLYHIEDPHAFWADTLRRRCRRRLYPDEDDDDLMHMRRISLRLFARLDLKRMRNMAPFGAVDDDLFDVDAWIRCVGLLPARRGDGDGDGDVEQGVVESVVIDLTPAPVWMALRRPDWVRATVLDARNKAFLRECSTGVRGLATALFEHYESTGVAVHLGGVVASRARRAVTEMGTLYVGPYAGMLHFKGEWMSGPADEPTRLALALVCRCWGVDVKSPARRGTADEERVNQVRREVRKEGLTTPDLDFKALGKVSWSKNSCTAYFVNAEEEEKRTRGDLIRLLSFAVEVRTESADPDAAVDFEPAVRSRRYLLHCLARDLGLASVSVGDAGQKFVRVSRLEEASAYEGESSQGGGGGGGDVCMRGEEEMTPSRLRAIELQRAFRRCDA